MLCMPGIMWVFMLNVITECIEIKYNSKVIIVGCYLGHRLGWLSNPLNAWNFPLILIFATSQDWQRFITSTNLRATRALYSTFFQFVGV